MNLVGEKKIIFDVLEKAMKNALIENNLEEVNDHALAFGANGDKCTRVRDDMSLLRSSISEFIRLRLKLRFQEKRSDKK